ncbi:MAG: DNA polymerase Y family protein [Sphingomicrobium sp.]
MKRVASLYLPDLPTDRLRRIDGKRPSETSPDRPLVTTDRVGQRLIVVAACPVAQALGLHPGMAVTQARALVPELDVRPADPQADMAVLVRLASFASRRWTPCAALSGADGLWLDLNGVAHLFGGERRLCERILRFCARLGFEAQIAVAGTTGTAHALARFSGQLITLCANGREVEAIAALPPAALRLESSAIGAARRFGIESIAELIAMPRGPLARRFGNHLLTRLDQALGRVGEPFDPIVAQDPPSASLRFVEPIASAEAIGQVLGDLVAMLMLQLEQRGLGARRLDLICDGVDGSAQKLGIGTAGASRDGPHLLRLLAMKIEQIAPGFGIEAMHLVAVRSEPLAPRQMNHSLGYKDSAVDLPPLIDRVASRIGASHIFRSSAVESDVPERSVRNIPPLTEPRQWPLDWPRPARLLPHPEPVEKVIAALPDQPPLRFSWRGETHRVRKADGPERIHGEWWKHGGEADAVRDYFQVEDEDGARFWLFRRGDGVDARTGDLRWYIHGVFA